jgi:3'-phosphoadenosine 5'-phosphosulfate sulfotransferase (PAPS reductase)/FAD synthetase
MESEKIDEFIENHKWQPIEDWEIDDIWQQIGQIARSMRSYIKKQASEQKG